MDYTVHGILQARIREWVAFPFSSGSSQPRDRTRVSCVAGGFFTRWEWHIYIYMYIHIHLWPVHVDVWQKPSQCCNYPPIKKNLIKKKRGITVNREAGTQRMTFTTLSLDSCKLSTLESEIWREMPLRTGSSTDTCKTRWEAGRLISFFGLFLGRSGGVSTDCRKDLTPGRTSGFDSVMPIQSRWTAEVIGPPWWSSG